MREKILNNSERPEIFSLSKEELAIKMKEEQERLNSLSEEEESLKKVWMDAMESKLEFDLKEKDARQVGNPLPDNEIMVADRRLTDATQKIKRQGQKVETKIHHRAVAEIAANPEAFVLKHPELVKQALINEVMKINESLRILNIELKKMKVGVNHPKYQQYQQLLSEFTTKQTEAIAEKNKVMGKFIKALERPEAERIYTEQKEKSKGQFFLD